MQKHWRTCGVLPGGSTEALLSWMVLFGLAGQLTSPLRAGPPQTPEKGRLFIQSFGISDYEHPSWPPLENARRDAVEIAKFFGEELGFKVLEEVPEEETTKEVILNQIRSELGNRVRPHDTAVIFFAGHGSADAGQTYLVDIANQLLPLADLLAAANSLSAERVMVIIDSCKSGLEIGSIVLRDSRERQVGARARILLTSASGGQQAQDGGGPGRLSLFTGHLLRSLRFRGCDASDRDGICTSSDIIRHVREAVSSASGQAQMPGSGRFGDDQQGKLEIRVDVHEANLWENVGVPDEVDRLRALRTYLEHYPSGLHVEKARKKIEELSSGLLRRDKLVVSDLGAHHGLFPANAIQHEAAGVRSWYRWIPARSLEPGFWIGETEVTVEEFETWAKQNPLRAPGFNRGWKKKRQPIVNIPWQTAEQFCRSRGGSLPTQDQWEYAGCTTQNGQRQKYPWGDVLYTRISFLAVLGRIR